MEETTKSEVEIRDVAEEFESKDNVVGVSEVIESKVNVVDATEAIESKSNFADISDAIESEADVSERTVLDSVNSADDGTKKKRSKRRFWEHPTTALRNVSGRFQALSAELRVHPEKFFNFYGMSISTYDELLDAVKAEIYKKDSNRRVAITPEERLTVTLRYLVTGATFTSLREAFLIGHSTISGIIKETCTAIWKVLQPTEMAWPTKEQWTQISENFYRETSFPNCLGAVGGKHVRIVNNPYTAPRGNRSKNYHSVVLMAVADADYKFTAIEVGLYGGDDEEFSFKACGFGRSLYTNQLGLPPNRPLPNTTTQLPHVFTGDEDFPLHENLMRPFPKKPPMDEHAIFNYRLARAHSCVECAYGILCDKWKLLHGGITVVPSTALLIVKAVCVLHNFVGERDGFNMEDTFLCHLDDYKLFKSGSSNQGKNVRQSLAEYFMCPVGEVSWQYHGLEKS